MYSRIMSSSNDRKIAEIKFTVNEIKRIAIDELLKNDEARAALDGKNIRVKVDWHVFKWDDPEHIATFTFLEEK